MTSPSTDFHDPILIGNVKSINFIQILKELKFAL